MSSNTKSTLSLIAYFLLLPFLSIIYYIEILWPLAEAGQTTVSPCSTYFIGYWAMVTILLPLIGYPFLHMKRNRASGLGYKFVRHFFLTNLGFSVIGFMGIVYEVITKLFG